jgi:hypothetical protein
MIMKIVGGSGRGRLPDELRAGLAEYEGYLVLAEGLRGSILYRNYRAPGQYSSFKIEAVRGAVAVTPRRLVVSINGHKHVDVPHDHPLRGAVDASVDDKGRLAIGYDPSKFDPRRTGEVTIRFHTEAADRILSALRWPGLGQPHHTV